MWPPGPGGPLSFSSCLFLPSAVPGSEGFRFPLEAWGSVEGLLKAHRPWLLPPPPPPRPNSIVPSVSPAWVHLASEGVTLGGSHPSLSLSSSAVQLK